MDDWPDETIELEKGIHVTDLWLKVRKWGRRRMARVSGMWTWGLTARARLVIPVMVDERETVEDLLEYSKVKLDGCGARAKKMR